MFFCGNRNLKLIKLNGIKSIAAATASSVYPFANAAVSVLSLRFSFNATYAGLGTPPEGPQVTASAQLKTWSRTT